MITFYFFLLFYLNNPIVNLGFPLPPLPPLRKVGTNNVRNSYEYILRSTLARKFSLSLRCLLDSCDYYDKVFWANAFFVKKGVFFCQCFFYKKSIRIYPVLIIKYLK